MTSEVEFSTQGFPNSSKGCGGESETLLGDFLLGEGNLRKSDFDDLNLFPN